MKSKDRGFTLVELIVVIVIIAILVGVTILGVTKWVTKARENIDINNFEVIRQTIELLNADSDFYNDIKTAYKEEFNNQPHRCAGGVTIIVQGWYDGKTPIDFSSVSDSVYSSGIANFFVDGRAQPAITIINNTGSTQIYAKIILQHLDKFFPNGLPKMQSGKGYRIDIFVQAEFLDDIVSTTCSWRD